jgi:Flp pilus assembly protein TadG
MASLSTALRRSRVASSRGAELVELALVMPVLLLMLAGIFDIGFLLNHYSVVTNAAREGARVAAVPGWAEDDVEARVNQYLSAAGLGLDGVSTSVTPVAVVAGTSTINAVEVAVSYPYDYLILTTVAALFQDDPSDGVTLTATATMRAEVAAGL